MNETVEAPSAWMMLESDEEVGHLLHDRHRLAHGVRAIPHKDGIALLGGPVPDLYTGYGLRKLLSQVLPLLNGTHTVAQIEEHCPDLNPRHIRDLIGSLFMSGLLRCGPADDLTSDMDTYLDRMVGSTGVFRSGSQAAQRLRAARLGIVAPPPVLQRLSTLFAEMEGGAAIGIADQDDLDADIDLLLVISLPGQPDPAPLFARANRLGIPALNVEIAGRGARLGPLVLPQVSASHACYIAAHARLTDGHDEHDPHTEMLWSAMALHMAVSVLTRTIKRPLVNAFVDQTWQQGRQIERRTTIARLHGWNTDGEPLAFQLRGGDPGYEGWKQYCGIALQTQDWHPANSYLVHFRPENIRSIFERVPAIFSGVQQPLPPLPSRQDIVPGSLSLATVGLLVTHMAGFQQRDGAAHRLVPTGGGLGSTLMLLLARNVTGIAPACYWFDANAGALERMKDIDIERTCTWLGVDPAAPAVLFSFANAAKVARKYGPFSVNISWYDAGVLLAYGRNLCAALGLSLVDRARPQPELLMQRLGLPATALMPTGVLELGSGGEASLDIDALLSRLRERRATRSWAAEVTAEDLARFCALADEAIARQATVAGLDLDISLLLLLKLSDEQDGFYQYQPGRGLRLLTGYDRERHVEVLSQARLTKAPLIVFPQIDLHPVLKAAGDQGVETAYRAAGAVVGDLWLNAASIGMAGTACGGAFEGRIRSVTARHGLECFAPLALCLGPTLAVANRTLLA